MIPAFSSQLPLHNLQLHASEYKNPSQLPDGAVLVVGSAQSGCQIAEELTMFRKKVFLSTSMVPRLPRRYRGKDILDWLLMMKFFDVKPEEVTEPKMMHLAPPQLTGTNGGKYTISLQSLAQKGVIILGKMENADNNTAYFLQNASAHVAFADGFSKQAKEMIDGFIQKKMDLIYQHLKKISKTFRMQIWLARLILPRLS